MAMRRRKKENRTAVYVAVAALIALLLGAIITGFVMLIRLFEGDIGSRGARVTVPSLIGMTAEDSEAALTALGLKGHQLPASYNDQQPRDRVFQQEPDAGDVIRPGRTVNYALSLGSANFSVPSLVGKQLQEAPKILAAAGLQLGVVQKIYTKAYPAGRILNQDPKMGLEYTTSIPVDLVVADGGNLPEVPMPDLIHLPLSNAEDVLTMPHNNLHLARVVYVANDVEAPGTVVEQNISAGQNVPMGTAVELAVALPGLLMAQPQKTVRVRIPVPRGPDKQQVRIKVTDALGAKVELDEAHSPGDIIERSIDVEGQATIQIFIGDAKKPFREEKI